MQRVHVVAAVVVLGLAGIAGVWLGAPSTEPPPVAIAGTELVDENGLTATSITVHVSGAVQSPGLVTLRMGDRVAHALAAAGGGLAVADLSALNLAAPVADGDQVTVPIRGTAATSGVTTGQPDDGLIDLNHASAADLEALPGVGPVLAQRIFEYRQQQGPFATVEDLLDVPGIGEGKLAALREALVLK